MNSVINNSTGPIDSYVLLSKQKIIFLDQPFHKIYHLVFIIVWISQLHTLMNSIFVFISRTDRRKEIRKLQIKLCIWVFSTTSMIFSEFVEIFIQLFIVNQWRLEHGWWWILFQAWMNIFESLKNMRVIISKLDIDIEFFQICIPNVILLPHWKTFLCIASPLIIVSDQVLNTLLMQGQPFVLEHSRL